MFEYAAFNPYNSSPEALAGELTKKSAEGWGLKVEGRKSRVEIPTFGVRAGAMVRGRARFGGRGWGQGEGRRLRPTGA